jgi:putative oxidoreductase
VGAPGGSSTLAAVKTSVTQKEHLMKTTSTVSRVLLGLVFTVFGLNGFLNLFSTGPVPPLAGQFFGILVQSHYMTVVLAVEIIGGLALLLNWRTPLALTLLGPVIFNILVFHITMAPAGLPPAVFITILWTIVAHRVRWAFAGLFQNRAPEQTSPRRSAAGVAQVA